MELRFSRRAVVLVLVFGFIAILGAAVFASLLTGSYEILALLPLSLLLWIILFVWIVAWLGQRARRREG
ncbi:MAG TPA: hypothetical protein VII27_06250 [Thermoplasmata archaeon]